MRRSLLCFAAYEEGSAPLHASWWPHPGDIGVLSQFLFEERGVLVDHATVNRWIIKYSPPLEEAFHRRKRPVWISWRMDETYVKVQGQWRYL